MAGFQPTASQKEAIETRGSAVLVSAGAGSGKTKVLTERLMHYVTDPEHPADLDSFLIITFTRAAAGELRGRILDELAARLAKDPGNRRLRRQSALCQRAQIGTIHSFCAALLRENSHLAGLSPDFKVVDEERSGTMMAAALERVMDACYEKPEQHPGFLALADTIGAGRDDRRLAELVLTLHAKMQSHARPERWAQKQMEQLRDPAPDAGDTVWGKEILRWARQNCTYWVGELDRLMEEMAGCEKIAAAYMDCISQLGDFVRELERCLRVGWEKSRACFPFVNPKLGVLRNSPDPALSDRVKARREACKKCMESIGKALADSSEALLRQLSGSADAMEALLRLTLDFDREYAAEKRRCSLVDYADLEHMTARLLTDEEDRPTELARQLSRRYTEIMVDEYQDVNRVQDSIFRAVSREEKNLFMVGDVKQSIYRFRLADPGIFTEKYHRFADWQEARPGEPRRILLQENFRSRREVLQGANAVFSLCMSETLGDIDYDEAAALKYGASYEGQAPCPTLMLLELPKAGEDEESPDKTALEARMVARRIRTLVESGTMVSDHGALRPMEYGDVAILLRSVNRIGGIYRRELAQLGVPVATGQGGGFFSSVEISTMLSMLAVLDDPHQDIPLIAVLRSPAYRFSADELSEIRAAQREGDFYGALCTKARSDEKSARFVRELTALRELSPDLPTAELCWQLLEQMDMMAICSAMNDGLQRRARLMELVELAEQFESSGYRGLHRFVQYLKKLEEAGKEPDLGADSSSAVQILSIHKSKGLEFPVVFVSDLARRFNKQDGKDIVLVHPELGLGPKIVDGEHRIEYTSFARNAIRLRLEREMLSEEMRLLYVAMTRARERLYLTAALGDPEKKREKASLSLSRPMAPEVLSGAGAFVDWLLWAALADGGEHLQLEEYRQEETAQAEAEHSEKVLADPEAAAMLADRLRFCYPHGQAQELPSKITATERKGREEKDEDAQSILPGGAQSFRKPSFAVGGKLRAAQRGTATHLVLQYMDFACTGSREAIREEIGRMEREAYLRPEEAQAVDAEAIYGLFASPLGKRMLAAKRMQREFKFSLLWDAGEIFGCAGGEELLLQGVVDCFLEEEDGLVVIDYKTDHVTGEQQMLARAEDYRPQLQTYAAALERICQKPVKECVLYFLSLGKEVKIPWKNP